MSDWLEKAIFYEIYPQSFKDNNGDGIGDFNGIIEKLDYIKDLGCTAIWMNPCFDSPFQDAGYDVRDFYKTAPRYGSNEDLKHLFDEVHKRDMHILLDLVPGHTSIDSPWFKASCEPEENEYTGRYIWRTASMWEKKSYDHICHFLTGISDRPGSVAMNCFSFQPALNYGFGNVTEDWMTPYGSPEAEKGIEILKDIMSFWLDLGCDGFRVDMAGSLVKEDPDSRCVTDLWQRVRSFLNERYPQARLVSEWGYPKEALHAGFHMDFLLHTGVTHYMDLFRTEPYFSASSAGNISEFAKTYTSLQESIQGTGGMICIPSGNHDMDRMREHLSEEEMKLAFAFLFTMPGCPFIYYGDEIGLPYMHGLRSKEGGFDRTGARTPMQWDSSANAGFSTGSAEDLYLPVFEEADRTTVEKQELDPASLMHTVKDLIRFRGEHPALGNKGTVSFLQAGDHATPLVLKREAPVGDGDANTSANDDGDSVGTGDVKRETILAVFNPAGEPHRVELGSLCGVIDASALDNASKLYEVVTNASAESVVITDGTLTIPAGHAVFLKLN